LTLHNAARHIVVWYALLLALPLVLALAGCGAGSGPDLSAHAYLNAVTMSSPTAGWAVGENGTILRFTAGSWQRVASPTEADLSGVAVASADEAWAVGLDVGAGHGVILHELHGNWTLVATAPLAALRGITMRSATDGWIVGDGGTILHLVGGHWTKVSIPDHDNLYSIAFDSAGTGWAVGYTTGNTSAGSRDTSVIMRDQNGVWQRLTPPPGTPYNHFDFTRLMSVVAAPNGHAWAVGASGAPHGLVEQNTSGTWAPADGGGTYELTAVALASASDGWAVGFNGEMLHFDGVKWQEVPRVTTEDLAGVALVAPGEGWAVGTNRTLVHLHQGRWTPVKQ
jgi:hypothetical protein